jgi:protein involved in ribonucleotide reduction
MGAAMPQFTPQLIRDMRKALEDVMTRIPVEYTTAAVRVYLAECILGAAAEGHTNYNELFTAAADQIQTAISRFT